MTKAIPRFKHRTVGPRKGNGAIDIGPLKPPGKRLKRGSERHLEPADVEGGATLGDLFRKGDKRDGKG